MTSPLLEVRGVSHSFAGIQALSAVDLVVEEGERVGLIGPNGAGKTTLFNCIAGLIRPDRGRIGFSGDDVSDLAPWRRTRLGMGRTFQRIELFADCTVIEHLLVAERVRARSGSLLRDLIGLGGTTAAEQERADEVINMLGLGAVAEEPIESLSLGQGRLVEVGRALMTQPRLLLLDEPSSGLDRRETEALAETLASVAVSEGLAVLLVEHDVELVASFTQRAYVLDFGTQISAGPTSEVLADPTVRRAYLGDLPETA